MRRFHGPRETNLSQRSSETVSSDADSEFLVNAF
jgi:hypothetical protein